MAKPFNLSTNQWITSFAVSIFVLYFTSVSTGDGDKNLLTKNLRWWSFAAIRRLASMQLLVLGLFFSFVAVDIAQAAPPVVALAAVLTKTADGTAPFVSIDPNGSNGDVATLDLTTYTFDVNINTLDAQTHTVSGVTIVASLDSTSNDVAWLTNTLPSSCATKTVSVDGKTLTCVLTGTYNTGTALNISGGWWAQAGVPNNTDVTVDFTVSATMVPDASSGDNPTPATSGVDTVTVLSEPGDYEVRKTAGPTTIVRDGSGNPVSVRVDWGIQVELQHPTAGQIKGINTSALGDLSLTDELASGSANQLPIQEDGTLVDCTPNTGTSTYLATSSSNSVGAAFAVQNSGTWSCSQSGGTGGDITMSATGINWSPDWFPSGSSLNGAYWAFNSGSTNEVYNSPNGQNNQAVVATQLVRVSYPYSQVAAFDNTAGDQNGVVNLISWCNEIGSIDVVGANDGVDNSSNNQACTLFSNGTGASSGTGKYFIGNGTLSGPEQLLNLTEGALGPAASDNYVAPGQKFGTQLVAGTSGILGLADWVTCDAFDQSKYPLVSHNAPSVPSGGTGTTHGWYSWYKTGTPDPSFPVIGDSDIVVEFSSTGSNWASASSQRSYDCDSGGLTWVTDPSTHPNGLGAVNLVRMTVSKSIPPGVNIYLNYSHTADSGLSAGTKLINFAHYKTSTLNSGNWVRSTSGCDATVDGYNSAGTPCARLVDRAIVIQPSPLMQKSDTPNTPTQDIAASLGLGSSWTYTLKAGLSWNMDVEVTGVKIYDVLPPGLTYQSASVAPASVIQDCDAAQDFSCIDTPAARTHIGYTTLVWNRGDFSFDHSGSAETPTSNLTLFGNFTVTAKLGSVIPNGTQLQNIAWVRADTGLSTAVDDLSFRSTSATHNDTLSGPLDDDWIIVSTAQAFAIDKQILEEEIPINGTLKFTLGYGNLSGVAKTFDSIDVFPYNGDGRSPTSVIDGNFSLTDITMTDPTDINQIYVTSTQPASIDTDVNNNVAVGTGMWSCTYAQIGAVGCPSASQVTAIRIKSNSLTAGWYGFIRVELTTADNDGEEVYTNNWHARATSLALPVMSSDVSAVTPSCLSVGNLVFKDSNSNGKYDAGDTGFNGVIINLMKPGDDDQPGTDDDVLYKTTTTTSDGRWLVQCVAPDDYFVQLDPSNFSDGGALKGYTVAPNGSTDPTDNVDENTIQDLLLESNQFRTNIFTVNYDGPTSETGTHPGTDAYDNLTIDLGLVLAASTSTPSSSVQGSSGSLSETGQKIVIGLLGAAMLIITPLAMNRLRRRPLYQR